MEIEPSRPCSEKLLELLTKTFPQFKFPEIQYDEKTEDDGSISYNARVKVLGQSFSSGPQPSKDEALESVSSLVYDVVKEFHRLVLSETDATLNCEALSSLFRPLKEEAVQVASTPTQEALHSVTAIKNRLVEVENEKINLKVKIKKEKIIEKMQPTQMEVEAERTAVPVTVTTVPVTVPVAPIPKLPLNEVKASITAPISLSPLNIESKPKEKERKTNLGAPIPAIYEYVEKQSSKDPIVFDDFVKGQFFGCRLRWGKKFWVAPAEHHQKKDAHNLAAVMACIESFGEGFTFEGVDPRNYFKWTRESVRQASDKYSFGSSDELVGQGQAKLSESVDVAKLKIEPMTDGRKYASVLNEICQKMRFTPPNYQVASVNALTNYYVCTVSNFHNLPLVESTPFTKKNEAKEDAAGKIYYLLEQQGIVDEASRIIGRQKVEYSATAPPHPPTQRSPTMAPMMPSVPAPVMPIMPNMPNPTMPDIPNSNFNMMQMMPMFMMAQMTQQQQAGGAGFDPQMMQNFDGMMKQWQAFLAWQQQNAQVQSSQSPSPPNQQSAPQSAPQSTPQNGQHDVQRNVQYDDRYDSNGNGSSRYSSRHNDNYSNSRKRNYEESRRRYYD